MTKRILGCLAHPDDEVLGIGGTIAHYAQQGARIEMVYTTRGEAGQISDPALGTPETLGAVREAEMRCSAERLGIAQLHFLGYRDSGMAETADNQHPDAYINAPAEEVTAQLVEIIRRAKPHVIFTFEPFGGYGHPDHIAIHKHTHLAITAAADSAYRKDLGEAWQTPRLFYPVLRTALFQEMKEKLIALGQDVSVFEKLEAMRAESWPDDNYQVVMDVTATLEQKWGAFDCHRTQFGGSGNLFRRLPKKDVLELINREYFALILPAPAPNLRLRDLFDGLALA